MTYFFIDLIVICVIPYIYGSNASEYSILISTFLGTIAFSVFGIHIFQYFKSRNLRGIGILTLVIVAIQIIMSIIDLINLFYPLFFFFEAQIVVPISLTVRLCLHTIYISLAIIFLYEKSEKLIPLTFEKATSSRGGYLGYRKQKNVPKQGLDKSKKINSFLERKKEIKELLADNKIKEVLSSLEQLFNENNDISSLNTIIILSGNFYEINLRYSRGTIPYDQYKISRAKIVENILITIDENW